MIEAVDEGTFQFSLVIATCPIPSGVCSGVQITCLGFESVEESIVTNQGPVDRPFVLVGLKCPSGQSPFTWKIPNLMYRLVTKSLYYYYLYTQSLEDFLTTIGLAVNDSYRQSGCSSGSQFFLIIF